MLYAIHGRVLSKSGEKAFADDPAADADETRLSNCAKLQQGSSYPCMHLLN